MAGARQLLGGSEAGGAGTDDGYAFAGANRRGLGVDETLFEGAVDDSGEGRWTINAAIDEAVAVPVLSAALYARFRSRIAHSFGEKILSAMRSKFGGHIEGSVQGSRATK